MSNPVPAIPAKESPWINGVVIRQIPTEEVVRIAKVVGKAPGLLVSHQA